MSLKKDVKICFDDKTNANTFNKVFCNLASNLVAKLPPPPKRFRLDLSILCNAMIQPFFDYACKAWYSNLNKNLRRRLQAAQNKCIRFCLKLGDRKSITVWKNLKKQIGCQFTNGSINAYFLVFINFMKKSTQLYR